MASSRRTIKVNPLDDVKVPAELASSSKAASAPKRSPRGTKANPGTKVKKPVDDGVSLADPSVASEQPAAASSAKQAGLAVKGRDRSAPRANGQSRHDAEIARTLGLRAPDGGRAFVRYVHDAKVSVGEVLLNVKSRDVGFLDPRGEFVSLMHLKGPVMTGSATSAFGPMALIASMMTGLVGCAAASLMKGRGRFMFRLGQFPNEGKYVSIDENTLNILKALAGRWNVKSRLQKSYS